MTNTDEISPFTVFISSSQKEFERLRGLLKEAIDGEEFRVSGSRIMSGVLIEQERGDVIQEDIKKALENCSIYVGIFGRTFSEWTATEYLEARDKGLPLLIYHLKKRRPGRPSRRRPRGRKSRVEKFLENEAKRFGVRVRGPYWREESLYDVIQKDLAYEIAELVKEATSIRRVIHKSLSS